MAKCRACHAPIIFAETARGARMPLDAGQTRIAVVHEGRVLRLETGHVPHHITCPHADQFRRTEDA